MPSSWWDRPDSRCATGRAAKATEPRLMAPSWPPRTTPSTRVEAPVPPVVIVSCPDDAPAGRGTPGPTKTPFRLVSALSRRPTGLAPGPPRARTRSSNPNSSVVFPATTTVVCTKGTAAATPGVSRTAKNRRSSNPLSVISATCASARPATAAALATDPVSDADRHTTATSRAVALPMPATDSALGRSVLHPMAEPHSLQQRLGARPGPAERDAVEQAGQGHVLPGRQRRQEVEELEHEAETAPPERRERLVPQ